MVAPAMEIPEGECTFEGMIPVSIVILNWNGIAFLRRFIPVVLAYSPPDQAKIIVADNGSTDESLEWLKNHHPGIERILLGKNHGYAGGYNLALEEVTTPFAVLLNSDVEVTEGWLDSLLEIMAKNEAGAAMPRIRSWSDRGRFEYAGAAGGWIDRFGYPFCRGRIFNVIEEDTGQYNGPEQVFWASGACMMVKMEVFRQAGGFDASFFAHMEEIDLCWRIHALGHSVWYVPGSTVYHVGGGTLPNENPHKIYLNFRNNLLLLYKNLPAGKRRRTLLFRMVFDGLAFLKFLVEGKPRFSASVLLAHIDFYRMAGKTGKGIKGNLLADPRQIPGWYHRSIVVDFFLGRKKRFRELRVHR